MIVRCDKCKYWKEVKHGKGECRYQPPQMTPQGYGSWPVTRNNDGCWVGSLIEDKIPNKEIKAPEMINE